MSYKDNPILISPHTLRHVGVDSNVVRDIFLDKSTLPLEDILMLNKMKLIDAINLFLRYSPGIIIRYWAKNVLNRFLETSMFDKNNIEFKNILDNWLGGGCEKLNLDDIDAIAYKIFRSESSTHKAQFIKNLLEIVKILHMDEENFNKKKAYISRIFCDAAINYSNTFDVLYMEDIGANPIKCEMISQLLDCLYVLKYFRNTDCHENEQSPNLEDSKNMCDDEEDEEKNTDETDDVKGDDINYNKKSTDVHQTVKFDDYDSDSEDEDEGEEDPNVYIRFAILSADTDLEGVKNISEFTTPYEKFLYSNIIPIESRINAFIKIAPFCDLSSWFQLTFLRYISQFKLAKSDIPELREWAIECGTTQLVKLDKETHNTLIRISGTKRLDYLKWLVYAISDYCDIKHVKSYDKFSMYNLINRAVVEYYVSTGGFVVHDKHEFEYNSTHVDKIMKIEYAHQINDIISVVYSVT
jgi:hypothetical protein